MTGRGRSRGTGQQQQQQQQQARKGAGRGSAQQTPQPTQGSQAPFVPAPAPAASAWSQPSQTGPPAQQSAWAKPQPQGPATVPVGLPAFRGGSSESKGRGRPQPPAQQGPPQPGPTQPGPTQQGPSQPAPSQAGPQRGNGGNGGAADRGSIRGRAVITDIIKTRPEHILSKRGNIGEKVLLTTNYFRLLRKPNWQLYQYRVDFSPTIEIRGLRNKLIFEQKKTLGGYLFDGSMLFLTLKLPDEVTQFMSKDRDGNPIQTTVKFVGLVSMMTASSIQILNLILRRSMEALRLQLVGRNFFDPIAKVDLREHRLQLWPGYLTSIRQHETDILMCAEITNKVMRTETIFDIMNQCYRNDRNYESAFKQTVLGMTVLTGYNNKTYRVDDVDFSASPLSTFLTKQGEVTFVEYYMKKYDIKIKDHRQPLLISKASARDIRGGMAETISLIPELCRATGLNERMRSDRKLMASLAIHTRLAPQSRIEKLYAFNKRLQSAEESVANFNEWNCKLDSNLVQVSGRVLPSESIIFGNNKIVKGNVDADWSREFRNISMFSSKPCNNWVIIYPEASAREVIDFLAILRQASNGMRYILGEPVKMPVYQDTASEYTKLLNQAANKDPNLIMTVLSSQNAERYSLIKKMLCEDRAIPSQVMVVRTITPKAGKDKNSLLTVGTKVAIQMNCKLGGAPWMVAIPVSQLMVVGFDVCHDTKDKSLSYGALVATMDQQKAQNYFSAVTPHKNGEELSNNFALNLAKALQCYKGQHGCLPERIYIYRDGVGEGQTNYVIEHEVVNIKKKLDEMYKGIAPCRLLFIVVSKRINTRFFKGSINPVPGTVVDDVVTLPERFDFFLISQSVKVGTVSPTSYNILHDTSGLPPERIQQITYKFTHLYYNWSGTLAVPAVCQYAHKLAFLVGTFIHRSPSSRLEKQLYFL